MLGKVWGAILYFIRIVENILHIGVSGLWSEKRKPLTPLVDRSERFVKGKLDGAAAHDFGPRRRCVARCGGLRCWAEPRGRSRPIIGRRFRQPISIGQSPPCDARRALIADLLLQRRSLSLFQPTLSRPQWPHQNKSKSGFLDIRFRIRTPRFFKTRPTVFCLCHGNTRCSNQPRSQTFSSCARIRIALDAQ